MKAQGLVQEVVFGRIFLYSLLLSHRYDLFGAAALSVYYHCLDCSEHYISVTDHEYLARRQIKLLAFAIL